MTLLALLSLLSTPSHAGRKPVLPDAVEDALAYTATDRSKAIAILEEALEGAKAKEAATLALYAGEQHRLAGDVDEARTLFTLASTTGDKPTRMAGDLGIALLGSVDGVDSREMTLLQKADERALPDTQNADRYLLLAIEATRRNDARNAGVNTRLALSYAAADPATKERITAAIESLKTDGAEAVSTNVGGSSLLDRARTALEKGDKARAAELGRKALAEAEADSFEALQASYMVKRAEATAPVNGGRLAVLLPLSGKYEGAAKQVRQALEMGYEKAGGNKELVFYDTGATTESAVAALEKAVLAEGAVGVVGPLLSDTTDAVVRAAAALEVPLLSLSQSNENDEHSWVFQGVPSIGDQTDALVRHMMVEENMERFAIFAPDTTYGHRAAEAFRASVEERKGTITDEVFYDPKANALMPFAAKLGNKDDESRKGELYRLRQAAKAAGRDPGTIVLPPQIKFQALFVPDSARKIPIACAALAYEEFPIGEFRPRAGDTLIPLLGLNGWNRSSLVGAGGEYARNSRFTEAYKPDSTSAFPHAYREATGRSASALEAVTVDAGRLLGAATRIGGDTRDAFREALGQARVDSSATGVSALTDRRVDTPIDILTIDRQGIRGLNDLREEE